MNRNAHVSGNTESFRRFALRPALGDIVTEDGVAIQRALTQRFIPGHAQPLRDRHLLTVSGIKDMLQPRLDIHLRQVSRLHIGDDFQHLQQLTNETFKGLLSNEGF